jgi:hypothetical protein
MVIDVSEERIVSVFRVEEPSQKPTAAGDKYVS